MGFYYNRIDSPVYCAVVLRKYSCMRVFVPTSENRRGWGAQGVTFFAAAELHSEGFELKLCSIQQLFGLLV